MSPPSRSEPAEANAPLAVKLLFVRHGATEWNRTKRAQGHADIDLDDRGRRQAAAAADELAAFDVAAVYSSDLARAVHTAEPIALRHGLPVEIDPDFKEIDQGDWTGLDPKAIGERWPELWPERSWCDRPGGESPTAVRSRALRAIHRVLETHSEGTVVVVTHGGLIRWVSAEALGHDDRGSDRMRGLTNGGAVSMDARLHDDRVVLDNLVRLDGGAASLDDPNV